MSLTNKRGRPHFRVRSPGRDGEFETRIRKGLYPAEDYDRDIVYEVVVTEEASWPDGDLFYGPRGTR